MLKVLSPDLSLLCNAVGHQPGCWARFPPACWRGLEEDAVPFTNPGRRQQYEGKTPSHRHADLLLISRVAQDLRSRSSLC